MRADRVPFCEKIRTPISAVKCQVLPVNTRRPILPSAVEQPIKSRFRMRLPPGAQPPNPVTETGVFPLGLKAATEGRDGL
jgi:hypothetical protein